jgi:glutamyl-tRNA reductase
MIKNINVFCISVSFKKAPVEVRESFAFSKDEEDGFLRELVGEFTGGVVLSTCNRTEIYASAEEKIPAAALDELEKLLGDFKGISKENIKKYCLYYQDEKAIRHLFKVCCGLDSMVLGEDEILHQTKEAYLRSKDSGYADGLLNIIFQGAFNCAKLTKSNSKMSNTPVSIGTLTANTIQNYLDENGGDKVLVIGATGKIGSIVARDLLDKGINVTGTARSHPSEELLCQTEGMNWIDYHKRYEYMKNAAAVVSATTSPHYTITMERFIESLGEKHEQKCEKQYKSISRDNENCEMDRQETDTRKLMIDLAVPCDIDKGIADISGIKLLDIDYFNTLSKANGNIRTGEVYKVKHIVNECVEELLKKLYMRRFQELFSVEKEKDRETWFSRMTYYLKDVLESEQLCNVLEKIYEKEMGE